MLFDGLYGVGQHLGDFEHASALGEHVTSERVPEAMWRTTPHTNSVSQSFAAIGEPGGTGKRLSGRWVHQNMIFGIWLALGPPMLQSTPKFRRERDYSEFTALLGHDLNLAVHSPVELNMLPAQTDGVGTTQTRPG